MGLKHGFVWFKQRSMRFKQGVVFSFQGEHPVSARLWALVLVYFRHPNGGGFTNLEIMAVEDDRRRPGEGRPSISQSLF